MTEKSTKDLREMCVIFLSQLFGILQVTPSSPHFTALSRKLAGSHRQFCFSPSGDCFHVDKNHLALQRSTQKLSVRDFYFRLYLCLSTGNCAALAPAFSAAWSCLDDQIALCLACIVCACRLVYTYLRGIGFIEDAHWFMSRKGIQACINKPSGISSFKIWISLTACGKVSLGCFSTCISMWLFGLLRQNILPSSICIWTWIVKE